MKKIILIILIGLLIFPIVSAVGLWQNLTAYYTFDNTVNVLSGTGSYPAFTQVGGSFNSNNKIGGYSYLSNSTSDCNALTQTAGNFFEDLQRNVTISFWIRKDNSFTSIEYSILGIVGLAIGNANFRLKGYNSNLRFELGDIGHAYYLDGQNITDSGWHHYVITSRNQYNWTLYVDGVETDNIASYESWVSDWNVATKFTVGCQNANSKELGVYYDELAFWNRTLEKSEVNLLYNSGNGLRWFGNTINYTSINLPINATQTYRNITFNCSAEAGYFDKLNLYIDGVKTYISDIPSLYYQKNFTGNGNHYAYCIANTTYGEEKQSNITYFNTIGFVENFQSFDATTLEVTAKIFAINISYDSDENTISGNLVYNGTNYIGIPFGSGNNIIFNKSIVIPNIAVLTNMTFYWNFAITNSSGFISYYNSTVKSQIVTPYSTAVDNCSDLKVNILNMTLRDEATKNNLNGSMEIDLIIYSNDYPILNITYHNTFPNGSINGKICVDNVTFGQYMDAVITYYADNHVNEYYYFDKYLIENTTGKMPTNIDLYDLFTDDSTSFLVTYKDENYLAVSDAIIQLWRYYVGDGVYRVVEMGKTSVDGETRLHFVTEDVTYKAIVYVGGVLQYTSPEFITLCQTTPCQLNLQKQTTISQVTNWSSSGNLNYNLTLIKSARQVYLFYSKSDGASSKIELNVTLFDGYVNNTVCYSTQTGAGGTLTCDVPETYSNATYYVELRSDGEFITSRFFSLKTDPFASMGSTPIIMTALLYLTCVLMALSSGVGVIVFGILGLIFASGLAIFNGGNLFGIGSAFLWLIIAGIILINKIASRRNH